MRKSTLLWLMLAVFCGTLLYHTSQKVSDGRGEIAQLDEKITREEESLRVLEAEWSYLNQPDRLEKLARGHLQLEPMKGRQFAKTADLPERLEPLPAPEKEVTKKTVVEKPPAAAVEKPVAQKPAGQKPAGQKPAEQKPAAQKPAEIPVVRLQKPPTPPQPASKPAPAPQTATRDFGELMKSLGVQ